MKKISLEKLSHYSIILIGISALFVSVWQINVSQNHNKLSVKPYLDNHLIQSDSTLTVTISNAGFGPAIIKKITFNYKGKEYNSLEKLLQFRAGLTRGYYKSKVEDQSDYCQPFGRFRPLMSISFLFRNSAALIIEY